MGWFYILGQRMKLHTILTYFCDKRERDQKLICRDFIIDWGMFNAN